MVSRTKSKSGSINVGDESAILTGDVGRRQNSAFPRHRANRTSESTNWTAKWVLSRGVPEPWADDLLVDQQVIALPGDVVNKRRWQSWLVGTVLTPDGPGTSRAVGLLAAAACRRHTLSSPCGWRFPRTSPIISRNCANILPECCVCRDARRRAGREVGPESSRPETSLAPRSSMFVRSPRHILGCQEAKRSAEPSANPLRLYPLRT